VTCEAIGVVTCEESGEVSDKVSGGSFLKWENGIAASPDSDTSAAFPVILIWIWAGGAADDADFSDPDEIVLMPHHIHSYKTCSDAHNGGDHQEALATRIRSASLLSDDAGCGAAGNHIRPDIRA
jgi:hypothetical protein